MTEITNPDLFQMKRDANGVPIPVIPAGPALERRVRELRAGLGDVSSPDPAVIARIVKILDERIPQVPAVLPLCRAAARPATDFEVEMFLTTLIEVKRRDRDVPPVYGVLAIEDVMSLKPSIGAIEQACRKLRTESQHPFLPDISEIVAAVQAAERDVSTREARLTSLTEMRAQLTRS